MIRRIVLAAIALSPLALLATRPVAAVSAAPCANVLVQEPLVVFDVTGSSFFGGLIHEHLVVYGNGVAAISSASDDGTSAGAVGASKVAIVDPDKAQRFLRQLASAGAFDLCDQLLTVNDIPLTTLTVLKGTTDATAHTFSYWTPDAPYGAVQQVIDAFIASTFPGF